MAEVAERYVEQLTTTAETLRRRFVAYYDGCYFLGARIGTAAERAREVAEPAAYDILDYTSAAVKDAEPLSKMDKDVRDSTVEMYLSISVLLIGLGAGQLAGAFALGPLLEWVFDPIVEFALLVSVPAYVYLSVKKNAAMDDVERRTVLFGSAVCLGTLSAHLIGPSMLSLAPAAFFVTPLLFALLLDNELLTTPLVDFDRQTFFGISAALTTLATTVIASFPLGYFSIGVFLLSLAHAALLFVHFQVIMQTNKDKSLSAGETQYLYVFGLYLLQLVAVPLFGYNLYNDAASTAGLDAK